MPKNVHAAMRAAQVEPKLLVIHRSGMVTNFEALKAGIRAFVGVAMVHGHIDACAGGVKPGADCLPECCYGKFMTTDMVVELPQRKEYLMALCEGHLAAADKSTADRALAYGRLDSKKGLNQIGEPIAATKEELKLASDTKAALESADAETMRCLVEARKLALAPAVLDPMKLVRVKGGDAASEDVAAASSPPTPRDPSVAAPSKS